MARPLRPSPGLRSTGPTRWTTSSPTTTSSARVRAGAARFGAVLVLALMLVLPEGPACASHLVLTCVAWWPGVPRAVNRLIDANKLPHLLLYGPPGTGKTSTIVACAKRLYGKKWKSMTLEVRRGGTLAGGTPCSALRCCVQFRSRQPWSPVPCAASQLNASDDRGIGVVRDQIKSFAGTMKLFSKGVKLVILDEADAMTSDAQFALRRGAYTPCRVPPTLP